MIPSNIFKAVLQPKNVRALLKRCATFRTSNQSTTVVDAREEDNFNEPIKYSTSKAATWPANGVRRDKPPIQGVIIGVSLAVFLIYFCFIREESDIDEKLVTVSPEMQQFFNGIKKEQERARIKYLNKTT